MPWGRGQEVRDQHDKERQGRREAWEELTAIRSEIRRHLRTPSLSKRAVPDMRARGRLLCEEYGWEVPADLTAIDDVTDLT